MATTGLDLAPPLQAWLRALRAGLAECDPPGRLRAGDAEFPVRADAELTVRIDAASLDQLLDTAVQAAERQGLATVLARGRDGARIALFNPVADPSRRQWLLVALRIGDSAQRRAPDAARRQRRHNPLLFAVSGPDGVGKTTLVESMKLILTGYPLAVSYFHPTSLVKDAAWTRRTARPRDGVTQAATPVPRVSRARAAWRRFALPVLRRAVAVLIGEFNYARRVNQTIHEDALANRIIVSDRYVYDRYVKMPLLRKEPVRMWAIAMNCRLMAPPRLTLILSDAPENIRRRKPELTADEITDYEDKLRAACARYGAPYRVVPVNGRTPAALAAEAVDLVLRAAGEELFAALDAGIRASTHPARATA